MLNRFEDEYHYANQNGISTNPVINAFQNTVKEYNIEEEMVQSFLKRMRADLTKQVYENKKEIEA